MAPSTSSAPDANARETVLSLSISSRSTDRTRTERERVMVWPPKVAVTRTLVGIAITCVSTEPAAASTRSAQSSAR